MSTSATGKYNSFNNSPGGMRRGGHRNQMPHPGRNTNGNYSRQRSGDQMQRSMGGEQPMRNSGNPPAQRGPTDQIQKNTAEETAIDGVYQNTRMTYELTKLVGSKVEVQVNSLKVYEGIFKTFSPKMELVLECAHLLSSEDPNAIPSRDLILEKLIVNFEDILSMTARNTDTTHAETDSFTDTGISGRSQSNGSVREGSVREGEMKELKPWEPGEDTDVDLGAPVRGNGRTNSGLEDGSRSKGWTPEEMFQYNETEFGVKSSYDDSMHLYTTTLEKKNTPEWQQRERDAEKLAAEIERNVMSRSNIELENGDEMDEEMKHSAVIRPASRQNSTNSSHPAARKYMAPHMRQGGTPSRPGGREFADKSRSSEMGKPTTPNNRPTAEYLKNFGSNFKLSNSSPSSDQKAKPDVVKSPQDSVRPVRPQPTSTQTTTARPEPPKPTAATDKPQSSPIRATEAAPLSASSASAASSSVPAAAAAAPAPASSTQAATGAPSGASETAKSSESLPMSNADTSPTTTTGLKSTLSAEAKVFKMNPDAEVFVPKIAPVQGKPPVSPGVTQAQALKAPQNASKTASVSVMDASAKKQEIPTPAQASGPPIINPVHQYAVYPPPQSMVRPRMYPDGVPPGHNQSPYMQQFVHPYGAMVNNSAQASQPPPPQANMPPPTPPSSHPQQVPHQPPPTMSSAAPMPNQHINHAPNNTVPYQGANQQYGVYHHPPSSVAQPQPQHPPPQASPHNQPPAASPVTAAHSYPNFHGPPAAQQFPQAYYPGHPMGGNMAHTAGTPTLPFMYISNPNPAAPYLYYPVPAAQPFPGHPNGFPPQ